MRNTTFKISKREVPSIYDHMQHFKKLITEKDSQLCWQCIVFWYEFYRKYFLPRERSTWWLMHEKWKKKIIIIMRKVVLTSKWSVLGFKAAKFCRPEQNIEFDPRLIRPHAENYNGTYNWERLTVILTVYCVQKWVLQKVLFASWAQHVTEKRIKKVVLTPTGSVLVQNSVRQSKILRLIPVWYEAQTIKFIVARNEYECFITFLYIQFQFLPNCRLFSSWQCVVFTAREIDKPLSLLSYLFEFASKQKHNIK